MTSLDVRDMLDLPSGGAPRPAKKQKLSGPRQSNLKGLAREVQSLGGDNPIALVPAVPLFKKRRAISRKPVSKWEQKPFTNSARNDDLSLRHWRKIEAPVANGEERKGGEEHTEEKVEDSAFAKFNVRVKVPKYDDDQYEALLKRDGWTKEETDYLTGVVEGFDLRWPVIWDRYEYTPTPPLQTEGEGGTKALVPAQEVKPRTMEDLKSRYYEIAAKMMAVNRPVQFMSQAEFSHHQMMSSYDPAQETRRKRWAEANMARSLEERKEEEQLLVELKRIMARSDRLNEERRELYNLLESRPSSGNISIYTTSNGLNQLLQQLTQSDRNKKRKSIMGPEATPAATPAAQQDRRDSAAHSAPAPTPTTNKKGPVNPLERRKLTEDEEARFGVSYHDRLTSGPSFRHEKTTKIINGKSAVVAGRMTNILTELEFPARLVMPTAEVCAEYEALLHSITKLLDTRKVSDKLDAEIKITEAQRAEKERKAREARGEKEQNGDGEAEVKGEDNGENGLMAAPAATPAQKKRSASVLSAVSDKSTKRQKN